jgi:hypothetical protein
MRGCFALWGLQGSRRRAPGGLDVQPQPRRDGRELDGRRASVDAIADQVAVDGPADGPGMSEAAVETGPCAGYMCNAACVSMICATDGQCLTCGENTTNQQACATGTCVASGPQPPACM